MNIANAYRISRRHGTRATRIDQAPRFLSLSARTWTTDEIRLLGTDTDQAIADRLHVAMETVRERRIHAGIEPWRIRTNRVRMAILRAGILATQDDATIAAGHGVQPAFVAALRHEVTAGTPTRRAIAARIGHMIDADIAREVGVSRERVGAIREQIGIKPYHDIVRAAIAAEKLFPTMDDAAIAARFGVSTGWSRDERLRTGHAVRRRSTRAALDALVDTVADRLGQESDAAVAARIGVHEWAVRRVRRARGITGHRQSPVWTPKDIAKLGTDSDRAVGEAIGIAWWCVRVKRIALGIPAGGGRGGGKRERQEVAALAGRLGRMTDRALAEATGIPRQTVYKARARRGIPAHGRAPAPRRKRA